MNTEKLLKIWFFISLAILIVFFGWLLKFFIYKIFINNLYFNFSYLIYLKNLIYLIFVFTIYFIYKKKNT